MGALRFPIGTLEACLHARGFAHVAGTDEAGRGALAGPLVAAAVVLPHGWVPVGLNDSKLFTPLQRDRLYDEILAGAVAVSVRRVTSYRLDALGLHRANIRALREAVTRLDPRPDFLLVDGFRLDRIACPTLRVVKGDQASAAVAAASIVAKVTRDRIMIRYARRYPVYGFERHKGYAVPAHKAALFRYGPSPIHRWCFVSVRKPTLWDDVADLHEERST